MQLLNYLAQLNTTNNLYGLYVNREDLNDHRIGALEFENGGLLDDKILVGNLDNLSCGFVEDSESLDDDQINEIAHEQAWVRIEEIQDYLKVGGEYDQIQSELLLAYPKDDESDCEDYE